MKNVLPVILFALSVMLSSVAADACAWGEYKAEQIVENHTADTSGKIDPGHAGVCHQHCHQHVVGLNYHNGSSIISYPAYVAYLAVPSHLAVLSGPAPLLEPPARA